MIIINNLVAGFKLIPEDQHTMIRLGKIENSICLMIQLEMQVQLIGEVNQP